MIPIPNYMKEVTNIRATNNKQYQWLFEHKCSHRHRYSTHFNCFLKDYDIKEKIGFLDIETSNLKANFGICLCWCVGDEFRNIYEDYLIKDDIVNEIEDKRIIKTCIDTIQKFDRIVTHYGTYFDVPFIKTRALIHGVELWEPRTVYHTDNWKLAKKHLCLHSNRQDVIAESLRGKTVKTRISHPSWRKATMGNPDAVKEVLDHCEKDIVDLRDNFRDLSKLEGRLTKAYL